MTPHLSRRREQLRALYGFDFPDDFFGFWAFVCRQRPLDPLHALADLLGVRLVGPFEVLAGRFDGRTPRYPMLLHWRYYLDPPEFFTTLAGDTDGLHWGYYFDDPAAGGGCVASYYAADAFEFSVHGDDLFGATRMHLELTCRDWEDYRDEDPDYAAEYEADLRRLAELRRALLWFATADRSETGEEYFEKYGGRAARNDAVVAGTPEGMGVVAPRKTYRRLSLPDKKLRAALRKRDAARPLLEEARQALRDGFPATALKLGKELWALGGKRRTEYAYELLDAAYAGLGREVLRQVLAAHRAHRDLATVDILEAEEG